MNHGNTDLHSLMHIFHNLLNGHRDMRSHFLVGIIPVGVKLIMRFIIALSLGRLRFPSTTSLGRDSQFLVLFLAASLLEMEPADSAYPGTATWCHLLQLGTLEFPFEEIEFDSRIYVRPGQ